MNMFAKAVCIFLSCVNTGETWWGQGRANACPVFFCLT